MHLTPQSPPERRVWEVGDVGDGGRKPGERELRLDVRPGDYRSFISLATIVDQLRPLASPSQVAALDKLRRYQADASPDEPGGHGRFLSDAVAFAVLRRISRESVYTARLIDHAARTLNSVLASLPLERVVIPDADRLDRPTLKVLARAALLAGPSCRFSWVWSFGTLPRGSTEGSLADYSRVSLFEQLAGMLSPTIVRGVESRASQTGVLGADGDLPYELSAALVVQNYDACFAWGEALEPPGSSAAEDPTAVEVLRLMALAAVNVGRTDAAVQLLGRSEAGCRERFRLAHLAYLQGLIEAKRSYDVATSDAHYHRGLAALDETPSGSDDHQLERAWLFNGLALNRAIEWRRDPALEAKYEEAFRLVKSAFDLVRDGSSRPCGYLRFNLVANLAFLFEMKGRYDLAIDALSRAFDFGPGSPTELPSGHVALSYRVGVLHHRLGDREGAIRLLREAESVDDSPENWPTQDRILRAIGAVTLADDELEQAESAFSEGLALSRENRSAGGATEHGRGLATVLVRQGRDADAGDLVESLAVEEGVTIELPETGNTPQPNPKLPAYFPEIDLEEAPGIDLNRYLAAVGPATTSWRS